MGIPLTEDELKTVQLITEFAESGVDLMMVVVDILSGRDVSSIWEKSALAMIRFFKAHAKSRGWKFTFSSRVQAALPDVLLVHQVLNE